MGDDFANYEDLLDEIPKLMNTVHELTAKLNVVADRAVVVAKQAEQKFKEQSND